MVFEKTLELRVQLSIVLDALDVMTLRHPFDMQDRKRYRKRSMGENNFCHVRRRTDDLAFGLEPCFEFFGELPEKLYMFCLFAGELQKGVHAKVVTHQRRPDVIEDERQNELFDQSEDPR